MQPRSTRSSRTVTLGVRAGLISRATAACSDSRLEKLATGLGQLGADPQTVQAFSKMAEITRKTAVGLAKGLKEQPAEPAHTMDSAMADTMRERANARAQAGPGV